MSDEINMSELFDQEVNKLMEKDEEDSSTRSKKLAAYEEQDADGEEDLGEEAEQVDSKEEEEVNEEQELESEKKEKKPKKEKKDKEEKKEEIPEAATIKSLEDKIASLEKMMFENKASTKDIKLGEVKINIDDLPQETKDLLEFTPGLDKLIQSIAAEQAKAIIENYETGKAEKFQETQKSKAVEGKEQSYWDSVDSWIQGQYPELSLPKIQKDPDFKDWVELRKNWVDTQLKSVDMYDTSGVKKVIQRFIAENNLDQGGDTKEKKKSLASARSPVVGSVSKSQERSGSSLFDDEVRKLKAGSKNRKYI